MNVVDHLTAELRRSEDTTAKQAQRIGRLESRLSITASAVGLTAVAMDATVEMIRDLGHDLTDAPEERAEHFAALGATLREIARQARAVLDEATKEEP